MRQKGARLALSAWAAQMGWLSVHSGRVRLGFTPFARRFTETVAICDVPLRLSMIFIKFSLILIIKYVILLVENNNFYKIYIN